MKNTLILIAILLAASFTTRAATPAAAGRDTQSFDAGWLFLKGDPAEAKLASFNDTSWRKLNLPNDWSIAGPFSPTNLAGGAGGFLPTGVAWYRKHFTLPDDCSNRCVFIEFGGVMANSDVYINGFHLGHRPYGYVSFGYELTGHLHFGGDNVIAVRTDTSKQPASRWYAGSGIYRHVRLVITHPLHFAHDGIFISTPKISSAQATVRVKTSLTNESTAFHKFIIETQVVGPDGKVVGEAKTGGTIMAKDGESYSREINVSQPQLWNLDSPKLYSVVSKIISQGNCLDDVTNTFGIRTAVFKAATGFWLNGKNFKIKGVCLHASGGAFGAAVPLDVWQQRLAKLKQLGVNAIRTAHNPPAPGFLDLCDRMGFLVMDEFFDCWTVGKNPYDYHLYFRKWSKTDERDSIRRDRNHPSIIIYSLGNEIHDTPHAKLAKHILKGLIAVAHKTDPTRPATMALFRPNVSHDYDDGLADMLDVVGQNYRVNELIAAHKQKPSRKILGTEDTHSRRQWLAVRDNPPFAGEFIWTGVDYLGEARHWPVVGHSSGLLDRTGRPRPVAFQRQSWWSAKPMVYMVRRVAKSDVMPKDPGYGGPERYTQVLFPDWTPRNPETHQVDLEVYSNCKEVELFLNGKSLGTQALHANATPRVWRVAYHPGTLKAVGRDHGKIVATEILRTAGQPSKIVLTTTSHKLASGWNNVAEVRARITDAKGVEIPLADNLVHFHVSGPGKIVAVDNGNNSSHAPFHATQRRAYEGECVAFIKATAPGGKIVVSADTQGLASGNVTINAAQ